MLDVAKYTILPIKNFDSNSNPQPDSPDICIYSIYILKSPINKHLQFITTGCHFKSHKAYGISYNVIGFQQTLDTLSYKPKTKKKNFRTLRTPLDPTMDILWISNCRTIFFRSLSQRMTLRNHRKSTSTLFIFLEAKTSKYQYSYRPKSEADVILK